jgi:hypothetical protein
MADGFFLGEKKRLSDTQVIPIPYDEVGQKVVDI